MYFEQDFYEKFKTTLNTLFPMVTCLGVNILFFSKFELNKFH